MFSTVTVRPPTHREKTRTGWRHTPRSGCAARFMALHEYETAVRQRRFAAECKTRIGGRQTARFAHLLPATLRYSHSVRRLFSPFLHDWPGAGLLLLRLSLACGLILDAASRVRAQAISQTLLVVADGLTATMLVLGFLTPIAGGAVCLLQIGIAMTTEGAFAVSLCRASVGLCVTLVGPGVWSIDARLFGRKRIVIKDLHDQ